MKKYFWNTVYFMLVFVAALTVATQALARRVNTYESTKKPLFFSVDKEDIVLSNSVTGRVQEVFVATGQHVSKGDLLVSLKDDTLTQRMSSLESVAEDNLSARTELDLLRAKSQEYEIRAPRDGVVYQIHAAEGSYLNSSSPVITLFADGNVKVAGVLTQDQYAEIQKNKDLDVYSPRFEQIYQITFEGVGRVRPATRYEESQYEVQFRFADSEEGAAFIEGESLEVVSKSKGDDEAVRPSIRVANFWNKFIIGN
jgi:multidrug resistance efflux pump